MLDWIKNNVKKFIALILSLIMITAGAANPEVVGDVIDVITPDPAGVDVTWDCTYDGIIHKEYLVTIHNKDKLLDYNPLMELRISDMGIAAHNIKNVEVYEQIEETHQIDVPIYDYKNVDKFIFNNVTGKDEKITVQEKFIKAYQKEDVKSDTWSKLEPINIFKAKDIKHDLGFQKVKHDETKIYKVSFDVPIQNVDDKYGSVGKVAFLIDGKEYHPWWNASWDYKVSSEVADVNFPYPISLNVSYLSGVNNATTIYCGGNNATNFTDIRFVLNDTTELGYWIKNNGTNNITVFVNVTANGTVTMYYGNPTAPTTQNGSATFDFFDDGIGNASGLLDNTKWETSGIAPTSLSTGGIMKVTPNGLGQFLSINKYVNCTMVTYAKVEGTVCRVGFMVGQNIQGGTTEGTAWYTKNTVNQESTTIPGFKATTFEEYTVKYLNATSMKLLINGTLSIDHKTYVPTTNLGVCFGGLTATGISEFDWVYVHKNVTSAPVWGTWGLESEEEFIIPVYSGWNLVAQLNQTSVNIQTLANYTSNVTHIRVWNASNQSFQIFTVGIGGNETALVHYGQAYWINVSANGTHTYKDQSYSSTQAYKIGWNDIGMVNNHSISETNTSLGSNCRGISYWNPITQKYQSFISGYTINENVSLNVSQGFRCYMVANSTWARSY